jgi:uncharacterized phage protein (TIGR01671 family)
MNRELKFRAWNKFAKEFYPKPFLVSNTGLLFIYNEEYLHLEEFDAVNPTIGLVLQQYTGVDDINKKSIFEGDIVKYKMWIGRDNDDTEYVVMRSVVEFSNGSFSPLPKFDECEDPWYSQKWYDFEVIGNIFETPDLLK